MKLIRDRTVISRLMLRARSVPHLKLAEINGWGIFVGEISHLPQFRENPAGIPEMEVESIPMMRYVRNR